MELLHGLLFFWGKNSSDQVNQSIKLCLQLDAKFKINLFYSERHLKISYVYYVFVNDWRLPLLLFGLILLPLLLLKLGYRLFGVPP